MIELDNLCLTFPLRRARLRRKLISGGGTSGGEIIQVNGQPSVAALQGISLELVPGDCIALIGHNGSGKTTLLRTIAGIYEATAGKLKTSGRISTMFSATLSLSDMETGLQNIGYSAVLHGISNQKLVERLAEIVDVCELGPFLNLPVSIYSNGMRARLGLAMAMLTDPEILLVDEALTATDVHFLIKIAEKTGLFGGTNTVSMIATHAREVQEFFCNKAIWLKQGRLKMFGTYKEVSQAYYADAAAPFPVKKD